MSVAITLGGIVAAVLALVGGIKAVKRWTLQPRDKERDRALELAEEAMSRAEDAQDDVDDLTHLLVNGESEAHDGVLIDLQQAVEEIQEQQQVQRRLLTEMMVRAEDDDDDFGASDVGDLWRDKPKQ